MAGINQTQSNEWSDATKISLRGLYTISVLAMGIGIAVVFVLNFATPTGFILDQFSEVSKMSRPAYGLEVGKHLLRLFSLILAIGSPTLLVVSQILRPISRCLSYMRAGQPPPSEMVSKARRRIINLPFIFVGFNVGMWILMPVLVFFSAYMFDMMNIRTAVVFSARASMVGLITSSIAFFRLEAYSRRKLIPFFFPKGHLADLKGAAKISISRRIMIFNRLGTVVPMIILLVTLVTVQWELDTSVMSAEEYGRRIIIFTLVLYCIFFVSTGVLHRLVSKSITQPLENMLATVATVRDGDYGSRIRVLGNDEIGVLGDTGNVMIKGLAERETLRTTFGKYVTPEIRDEILSGRIPLEGERREATVLFADLRNFTPFVEDNPPEEVILGMRAYFTSMHQAIHLHRGLVLQFVGDEIEAVFGVPVHFEGHADAAVRAALEMRKALEELNIKRSAQGKPIFAHGVGIHSGDVLAGNTGSEEQSAYALIGNTVNVASRIQDLTKELGCDILASGETIEQLKESFQMDKESPRLVKGYSRPITVHRILSRADIRS